jgi:hypothetical protein
MRRLRAKPEAATYSATPRAFAAIRVPAIAAALSVGRRRKTDDRPRELPAVLRDAPLES